ncbi:MAG: FAD-dependent oxidoreductase [Devosiaceae bacterium]|nr:FAD-dependent oxidoreductase [Devosiaceae bacterium]
MKITIVGAGISGLLSAYYLLQNDFDVEIFEKSDRPGGLIQTLDTPYGPMDYAASSLINSKDLQDLFEQIGLEYAHKGPLAGVKNFYRNGMRRWPLGFVESARLIIGAVGIFLKKNKGLKEGQTVREWGEKVLGKAGYTYVLETFLQGVYAGNCSDMSAPLVLGPMFERKKPKQKPQVRGSVMPVGGMGKLIQKLAHYLEEKGVRINYNRQVAARDFVAGEQVVIATSAGAAGKLLTQMGIPAGPALSEIDMLDLAGVHLVFGDGETLFEGFGCLFPVSEGFNSLGVLAGKNAFPNEYSYPVERWIMGGSHSPHMLQLSDDELIELALADREKLVGRAQHPIKKYVLRRQKSLPHYTLELEKILNDMVLPPNLHLIGNYMGGIGLSAINRACQLLPDEISKN